ncbi:hypothetical protein HPP92_014823 [Vanilla planifolia]|uniref:Uncharacterized protein n=1 Tax=Vanilla planifolia TaxID=51239 RepID=A0A835QWL8_VANPL|nr:hypothetical protein HPP92_014823 [Vanilla planifolia]
MYGGLVKASWANLLENTDKLIRQSHMQACRALISGIPGSCKVMHVGFLSDEGGEEESVKEFWLQGVQKVNGASEEEVRRSRRRTYRSDVATWWLIGFLHFNDLLAWIKKLVSTLLHSSSRKLR